MLLLALLAVHAGNGAPVLLTGAPWQHWYQPSLQVSSAPHALRVT